MHQHLSELSHGVKCGDAALQSEQHYMVEILEQACQSFAPGNSIEQIARAIAGISHRIAGIGLSAVLILRGVQYQAVVVSSEFVWYDCLPAHNGAIEATKTLFSKIERRHLMDLPLTVLHTIPLEWCSTIVGHCVVADLCFASLSPTALAATRLVVRQGEVAIANASLLADLAHAASTDPLTRLANRRSFQHHFMMRTAGPRRDCLRQSLLLLDIDYFKTINDSLGHAAGDSVLVHVATILEQTVSGQHLIARYGGDEFVVFLDHTGLYEVWVLAERIRLTVAARTAFFGSIPLKCTLSLGVASIPEVVSHGQGLIDCADQALYLAKRAGRNKTVVFPRQLEGAEIV